MCVCVCVMLNFFFLTELVYLNTPSTLTPYLRSSDEVYNTPPHYRVGHLICVGHWDARDSPAVEPCPRVDQVKGHWLLDRCAHYVDCHVSCCNQRDSHIDAAQAVALHVSSTRACPPEYSHASTPTRGTPTRRTPALAPT